MKDQNWFAVALDFFIVVFGILIAFQITNWSDARSERIDAGNILVRLEQDFQQKLDRTDRSLALYKSNLAAAGRLIRGIRQKQLAEETLLDDISIATEYTLPTGPSITYTELVSDGRLQLIQSDELRRALSELNDYVNFARGQHGFYTSPLDSSRGTLISARSLIATGVPVKKNRNSFATKEVDHARLINDPDMLAALQTAYGIQDNLHAILLDNRQSILGILDLIKVEQKKR
ncbi:DUF6090 family protein [Algimonas arctica]|uniref:DUF6090 family protein n=1 Tax=Algimonas arctica TaxID=1479486 RepID=UPI0016779CA0|nr:DUF6090 family protein [Algimonas arctica]